MFLKKRDLLVGLIRKRPNIRLKKKKKVVEKDDDVNEEDDGFVDVDDDVDGEDEVDEEDDADGEDEVDEADYIDEEDEVVVEDDVLEKGETKKAFPKYRPSYHGSKQPYSGSNWQASKCHAWLLCVLIPTGMPDTEDWLLNLNRIGEFKINMIKNVVLVFWDLILSILTDITEWYRFLFRMFADKIRKLLSFRIEKDSVSQLQLEVNETICVWEALFPDDQNYFQLHQIMDLVSAIPLHGSMHAWSELFGEQALAKLKKIKTKTNTGGTSYEIYIMERQVNSELDTMTRFYSKAVNKVNKKAANYKSKVSFDANTMILSYKVMQFHIYDVEKKHKSSGCVRDLNRAGISTEVKNKEWVFSSSLYSHELNALVSLLLMEIRKRYKCESECNKNSCLYRCFSAKKHGFTNVKWLEDVVVNDDLEADKDVLRVARSLLSLQPSFCSKALIYGLQFRSRGSIYREYYEDCIPPYTRFGAEKKYDAREDLQWKDKANYSSWCMFQQSDFKIPTNKVTQTSLRYGKLNAFFEICIGDRSIDGMLVASITSHKVRLNSGLVDIVDRLESLDPSIIFVALQDIYPTRIAIVAIAANGKPNKINNTVTKEDKKFVNLRSLQMEMSYSYMLKMDADKMSRFPIYRPWTLYLSSSNKSGGSSSSTKTSVNLADENFDFNTNGFVMQPHRNSCSSTSNLRVLANRKSSKWKLHASSAFSDRPNSVEPSHSLLHAPPVSQDKQSNSSNSSYSNSKPPKYGFQMRPFNSIYAFEDNPHLYKPFPQDTGSQLRTYASPAFIDRSKSVEPSHSLLHAPFVSQDKQSNSSNSSHSNSKPPKYGFQMRPQNSISALADDQHLYKPFHKLRAPN